MKTFGVRRILWSLLNLSLFCCVLGLGGILRRSLQELDQLRTQIKWRDSQLNEELRASADAEDASIAQRDTVIAKLRDEIGRLKSENDKESSTPKTNSEDDSSAANIDLAILTYRPSIQEVPILSKAEYADLSLRRKQIPRDISDRLLLQGDVDSLLGDPGWNPDGRELEAKERLDLSIVLKDYLFYARLSQHDRIKTEILPLVEQMRGHGEYIEYPADEPPPHIEGVSITHADLTEDRRLQRLYVFRREDYPEMYHAQTVESQRGLETFVQAYEIINKPKG